MRPNEAGLSRAHTAKGRLQRELLDLLRVHERDDMLPTSIRFLFYELVQLGVVMKAATGKPRRADQNTIDAVTHLREAGLVPWDWIVDETRELVEWLTASSVTEYVLGQVDSARLDRWGGQPAPLILCESRSLAGTLRNLAYAYACPIASTNGQTRGFLITTVAPMLRAWQRVLYLGDFDWCGQQIEAATRRTLAEHTGDERPWERIALTAAQVSEHNLPVIQKLDRRYGNGGEYHDAVETEALGQARIVAALRTRLDELMPEPLGDVLEREEQQRAEVAEQLRRLRP
jgi:hypothetical protein